MWVAFLRVQFVLHTSVWFHFAFYIVSDYDAYKCFANIVLGNSLLVNNFQRKGVDESEMFNTIVMNTVWISEIRAKTVSDAATEFIIKKLQTDFKDWGLTAITRIEKSNLKLNDYINGLRMSFLTNELPLEYTSIIFDHYILKGEYSLISTIIYYLKLKWGEMRTIKNKGLTVTNLFSPSKSLNLYSKSYIKSYEDLQKKFKAKMQFKNILDIQVKLSSN